MTIAEAERALLDAVLRGEDKLEALAYQVRLAHALARDAEPATVVEAIAERLPGARRNDHRGYCAHSADRVCHLCDKEIEP